MVNSIAARILSSTHITSSSTMAVTLILLQQFNGNHILTISVTIAYRISTRGTEFSIYFHLIIYKFAGHNLYFIARSKYSNVTVILKQPQIWPKENKDNVTCTISIFPSIFTCTKLIPFISYPNLRGRTDRRMVNTDRGLKKHTLFRCQLSFSTWSGNKWHI